MKALTLAMVVLFAAGLGGGYFYLTQMRGQEEPETAPPSAGETGLVEDDSSAHGSFPAIPAGAVICAEHHVPEAVCPFCHPEFIDEFGHCGGHDVPEALCTRCHPILIAAFKAEGDWCAEHGLPESQCLVCNPPADGGSHRK